MCGETTKMDLGNKKGITFEELLATETFGAFDDFVSVKVAKERGLIPPPYHNIFKDTCECGSEMIIRDKLTRVQCCNPRCYIKLGYALDELFTRFGCKDLGPATCISAMKGVINKLEIPSHVEILGLEEDQLPLTFLNYKYNEFMVAKELIFSKAYSISELVPKLALPTLDKTAASIFAKYNDAVEFIEDFQSYEKFSTFMYEHGVADKWKIYCMRTYAIDILKGQMIFNDNFREKPMKEIELVITGYISPNGKSMTKDEYVEYLNTIGIDKHGVRRYGFRRSEAVESVHHIIADAPSGYKKYRRAVERGVLISSTDFLNQLKELMVEYNGVDEEPETTDETIVTERLRNEEVEVEDLNSLFTSEEG
ncbi:hypothetical protein UT300012_23110 [Paraclostridium bifermentans]